MLEKIEYYRLIDFINNKIIKEKINNRLVPFSMNGGAIEVKKNQELSSELDKSFLDSIEGLVGFNFTQEVKNYQNMIQNLLSLKLFKFSLAFSIILATYIFIEKINETIFISIITASLCYIMYIITTTEDNNIDEILNSVTKYWDDFINLFTLNKDIQVGGSNIYIGIKNLLLRPITSYFKNAFNQFKLWFNNPDKNLNSFKYMLVNIITGNYPNNVFKFNPSTGEIECSDNKEHILYLELNNGLYGKIIISIKYDKKSRINKIFYTVDSLPLNTISYIESKKVSTALVLAYLSVEKEKFYIKQAENYVYEFTFDNNLKLYDKNTNKEIMSVSMAIYQFISGNDDSGIKTMENVCRDLFKIENGLNNSVCSKHFYSILGRSALSMLKNLNKVVTDKIEIKNILINSNPAIKYEILKNLNWKIKINENGRRYLITVDEWLNITNNEEYNKYLNSPDNYLIKEIITKMIDDINNSSLLEEKYNQAISNKIVNPNYNKKIIYKN